MSYDGSIFAFIGADTKDYEKAMNDVIATTKKDDPKNRTTDE